MHTEESISAMTQSERLAFINNCRMRVVRNEEITDDELQLSIFALRIERASGSGARSKTKAPAKQMTIDDL